jgi:hypothetical protein
MTKLDDLPPDQKAALSLLLREGSSFASLATALSISEQAVHDRAHAALAVLAPGLARELSPEEREQVGQFMLGAQDEDQRAATRRHLERSQTARAWASALAGELSPLGADQLPELPALESADAATPRTAAALANGARPPAPVSPPPVRGEPAGQPLGWSAPARPSLPVSRPAGAVLLAVIAAAVVLAIVFIPSGSSHKSSAGANSSASKAAPGSGGGVPKADKRITLRPPSGSSSHAVGVAEVLNEGSKYAFYMAAEKLPPSKGFFYAVWLYNSPSSAEALGKSPPVSSNGRLQGGSLLPADAARFHHLLLTRETSEHPSHPGTIALSGAFALH